MANIRTEPGLLTRLGWKIEDIIAVPVEFIIKYVARWIIWANKKPDERIVVTLVIASAASAVSAYVITRYVLHNTVYPH